MTSLTAFMTNTESYREICLHVKPNEIAISLITEDNKQLSVVYEAQSDGTNVVTTSRNQETHENINGDYLKTAVLELRKMVFSSGNFSVHRWNWRLEGPNRMMFLCYLKGMIKDSGRKLTVEDMELAYCGEQNELMTLLEIFQPKTLKSIILHHLDRERKVSIQLNKATETEHWKHAERLILHGFYVDLPIQKYFHFQDVHLEKETITVEDVEEKVRNYLYHEGSHFMFFLKFSSIQRKSIRDYLSKFVALNPERPTVKHVKMAGTAGHLTIEITSDLMFLHRYQ